MYHLISIIATLALVSAIPLPQYDLPTSLDFVTSEPTTSIDTANADSYFPTAPILISEETTAAPTQPAPRPGLDSSWTGKDREPTYGDTTGLGPKPKGGDFTQEALDYWRNRGFPRILDGHGTPATPSQNGGRYSPSLKQPNNAPPPPESNNDAGIAGAATSVFKGIIDRVPTGLNTSPAGGY